MNRLSIYIFLTCFACIISSGIAIAALTATPQPPVTPAPTLPTRMPAPTATVQTYTVTADTLNVRNADLEVVGYLHQGDQAQCYLTDSGWCMMEKGERVWSGCLKPNPYQLGCEAK